MKLDWPHNYLFKYYLKTLKQKNVNKIVIEALEIITSDTVDDDDIKKVLPRLQKLSVSEESGAFDAIFLLGMFSSELELETEDNCLIKIKTASDHGIAFAQFYLGAIEKDNKTAIKYFELAAAQGFAQAQYALGECYWLGVGVEVDLKRAQEFLELATAQGDPKAQFALSEFYREGLGGIVKDEKRARELLELSAEQGYAEAQGNLGFCLQTKGTPDDIKRGIEYLMLASQEGSLSAQSNLASYVYGNNVAPKNIKHAFELFMHAAMHPEAGASQLRNLGSIYFHPDQRTFIQNKTRTYLLYQAAALAGDEVVLNLLNHPETQANYKFSTLDEAFLHYHNIAFDKNKPDAQALSTVAFCYQMGLGITQDIDKAIEVYQIAIEKGAHCLWDLWFCHCYQYYNDELADDRNLKVVKEFYQELQKSLQSAQQASLYTIEKALLLGYVYEMGSTGLTQNLIKASQYYELAKSQYEALTKLQQVENSLTCYATKTTAYYLPLLALTQATREATQLDLNHNLADLIVEYAFEPSQPANATIVSKESSANKSTSSKSSCTIM